MNQKDGYMIFRPVASMIVALAGVGLMYVWLDCRCRAVGKEIQKLEQEKTELMKKQSSEQFRWTQMKAPRNVEHVMRQRNMQMDWPKSAQVVHLPATAPVADEPGYSAWSMQFARVDTAGRND